MSLHILDMPGLRLPADGPEARDFVLPPAMRTPDHEAAYDRHTLIYDVTRRPGGGGIVVTCPRLFNLWPTLRDALPWRVRRLPFGPRSVRFRQSEHLLLPDPGERLQLDLPGGAAEMPVRPDLSAAFAGANVLTTINRDNDIDWLRDWARFYVGAHGAEAVLITDNGSTTYTARDLGAALLDIPGIRAVAVVSTGLPFGPKGNRYRRQSSKFLQVAMLNHARLTHLARARAVTNADPDEIIRPLSGVTLFDAAVARRNRFVKVGGEWVYPEPGAALPSPQKAHDHRAVPRARCNEKWCAVPSGLMSRFGWDWHKVGDEASRPFPPDPRFELLHCRATTTGWKRDVDAMAGLTLERDPDIAAAMARWIA